MNLLLILAIFVVIAILGALAVRAIGGNFTLVEDWCKAWKFYSTYALALIAFLPDIFNALIAGDFLSGTPVGDKFSIWLKIGAAATFVLRMVRQVKPPASPFDESDQAGA